MILKLVRNEVTPYKFLCPSCSTLEMKQWSNNVWWECFLTPSEKTLESEVSSAILYAQLPQIRSQLQITAPPLSQHLCSLPLSSITLFSQTNLFWNSAFNILNRCCLWHHPFLHLTAYVWKQVFLGNVIWGTGSQGTHPIASTTLFHLGGRWIDKTPKDC